MQAPYEGEFVIKLTVLVIQELLEWYGDDVRKDPVSEAWSFGDAL